MSGHDETSHVPNVSPWRARCAIRALQISVLLGMQAMLEQAPPIQRRSTRAVRWPDLCEMPGNQLAYLPAAEHENFEFFDVSHELSPDAAVAVPQAIHWGDNAAEPALAPALTASRRAFP
jgi:hypothetical protein